MIDSSVDSNRKEPFSDYKLAGHSVSLTDRLPQWCLLLSVAMLGIAGSIFTLDGNSEIYASFLEDSSPSKKYNNVPMLAQYREHKKMVLINANVKIEGIAQTNNALVFSLLDFRPDQQFEIDFGNGSRKKVKQKEVHFSYAKAGSYIIKLIKTKKNSKEQLTVGTIDIKASDVLYGQLD